MIRHISKLLLPACAFACVCAMAATPHYKPSSRSPESLDITTNAYGFSPAAPDALAIGDIAPGFELPRAGGGTATLAGARAEGPVALIFYRGHW